MAEVYHELRFLQLLVDRHDLLDEHLVGLLDVVEFHMAQEDVVGDAVGVLVAQVEVLFVCVFLLVGGYKAADAFLHVSQVALLEGD